MNGLQRNFMKGLKFVDNPNHDPALTEICAVHVFCLVNTFIIDIIVIINVATVNVLISVIIDVISSRCILFISPHAFAHQLNHARAKSAIASSANFLRILMTSKHNADRNFRDLLRMTFTRTLTLLSMYFFK